MNDFTLAERRRLEARVELIKKRGKEIQAAKPIDKDAIESAMDELDGCEARLRLLIEGQREAYAEFLAKALASDAEEDWATVLQIEAEEIELRVPPNMRAPDGAERRSDYLARHPLCASCEARGNSVPATTPIFLNRERWEEEDNLAPLCSICAYVLVARANRWPVRGADANGHPNDPNHPWNRER